jgi:hypothetical protein
MRRVKFPSKALVRYFGCLLSGSPFEGGKGDVEFKLQTSKGKFQEVWGKKHGEIQDFFNGSFAIFLAQADIRDIRDPIHIPYPWLWVVYLLTALLVFCLGYWGYRAWKKRAQKIPVKLSHEIALERLEAARRLMMEAKVKEFSIEVSDAVRVYIEERFQVAAAHRTTEEFLHDLLANGSSPLAPYSQSLQEFLKFCDLAKFAKWALSGSEMQSMYESAKRLVEGTIPKTESI